MGLGFGSLAKAQNYDHFEKKIRPVLVRECYSCHSQKAKKIKGSLLLDSKEGMLQGGDSGPVLVPGKAGESLLIKALLQKGPKMPPKGPLPKSVIADFQLWIQQGAPDPRTQDSATFKKPKSTSALSIEEGRSFWAFKPLQKTVLPKVKDEAWVQTFIDRYILKSLESKGLEPAPQASRVQLIRRLYFDLIGLPPSTQEVEEFLADTQPGAWERWIDRLLRSKHFGERWGRRWLDVARYADSTGGGRTLTIDEAWRYRDYVVRSFNQNKSYFEFIQEQVAGDLLITEGDSSQKIADALIATGFLLLGPNNYENQDKDLLRMDVVDEQIDTLGRATLAMSLGCARCHDHKFDPIPTSDYYALAGIFRSTKTLTPGNVSGFNKRSLPLPKEQEEKLAALSQNLKNLEAQFKEAQKETKNTQKKLQGLKGKRDVSGILVDDDQATVVGNWTSSTSVAGFVGKRYIHDANEAKGEKSVTFTHKLKEEGLYELLLSYTPGNNRATRVPITIVHAEGHKTTFINQKKNPPINNKYISLGKYRFLADKKAAVTISNKGTSDVVIADSIQFVPLNQKKNPSPKISEAKVAQLEAELKEFKSKEEALKKQVNSLKAKVKKRPVAIAVQDESQTEDWHIHIRGEIRNLGPKVPRGFLTVLPTQKDPISIPQAESGRKQLAHWLVSGSNPLPTRVYVNRVWSHLFGKGLVRTVDNFGVTGEAPSHPELLDALSRWFIENGGSTKALIKLLVRSKIYALSTQGTKIQKELDPQNRLLSHMNLKRLDAEAFRDALLSVSGELDLTMGGPSIDLSKRGKGGKVEYGYQYDEYRRSIYVPVFRNSLYELFDVLDFADPNFSTGLRPETTRSTQALFLMNSPFMIARSKKAGEKILTNTQLKTTEDRIQYIFNRILNRAPSPSELKSIERYLQAASASGEDLEVWAGLCQTLFASLDFRFLK